MSEPKLHIITRIQIMLPVFGSMATKVGAFVISKKLRTIKFHSEMNSGLLCDCTKLFCSSRFFHSRCNIAQMQWRARVRYTRISMGTTTLERRHEMKNKKRIYTFCLCVCAMDQILCGTRLFINICCEFAKPLELLLNARARERPNQTLSSPVLCPEPLQTL